MSPRKLQVPPQAERGGAQFHFRDLLAKPPERQATWPLPQAKGPKDETLQICIVAAEAL